MKAHIIATIFILMSGNCFATAEDEFQKGVKFFKQQNYTSAITAFNNAARQGMKKPALYHNLGASYYKLGQYSQAKKQFENLRRYPNERMQAEYNLGLIAKKQNQPALAKKQFSLVKTRAKNNKLITLARMQLGEIMPVDPSKDKSWLLYANVGYGQDSNVATAPDIDAATHISSAFSTYYIDGELKLIGDNDAGISVIGAVSRIDYSKTDLYDFDKTSVGVQAVLKTGGWDNIASYELQDSSYGNYDFERTHLYELGTKYYLTDNLRLRLRYRYYGIYSRDPLFDILAGNRQRLRAELKFYGNNSKTRFYFENETNDRADDYNPATERSYSPTRTTLHADYTFSFTDSLSLRGDISYRESNYPALGRSVGRDDQRARLGLKLNYDISNIWRIRGIYEHTENVSTDATNYSYTSEITAVEIIADF